MSGFVCIVSTGGRHVDRELLLKMTQTLSSRGPDGLGTHSHENLGMGHTLFKTTDEAEHETQPYSDDGQLWIVADARIDARDELLGKLRLKGQSPHRDSPDVNLILAAYRAWGKDCVQHLLGDFAFVIWDPHRRSLFCARDHMGVRQLMYARTATALVISNSLPCIRKHPGVSSRPDEMAIADFLLFGVRLEKEATAFADVRRLAPAHAMTFENDALSIRRYWSLPIEEPLYLTRDEDYPEQFNELVKVAVTDRTRCNRIAILMSGGLDSTSLAFHTTKALSARRDSASLQAFTSVLGPSDDEGTHAQAVARHLNIGISLDDALAMQPESVWTSFAARSIEPSDCPLRDASARIFATKLAAAARVTLYGEGPDNALMYEWKPYLRWLLANRRYMRFLGDVARHVVEHKRVPLIPTLPQMFRERNRNSTARQSLPNWLETGFSKRLDLAERWNKWKRGPEQAHPVRPKGHASFSLPLWQYIFERQDPEASGAQTEYRHPFLDLRVISFMLRVPALPWCREKHLMRTAGIGNLPSQILSRKKTPVQGDPWAIELRRSVSQSCQLSQYIAPYVDPSHALRLTSGLDDEELWQHHRMRSLDAWLASQAR